MLTLEPRGRPQASVNLVFPPSDPRADAGFVVLQADRAHAMSGSNTICVVTALLETGALPMAEPTTGSPSRPRPGWSERRRPAVTVVASGSRSPAFRRSSKPSTSCSTCPASGTITVDVAYGGCFYVLVDAAALGVRLTREGARDVVERAELVMAAAEQQLTVRHPEIPEIDFVSYVMVTGEDDPAAGRLRGRQSSAAGSTGHRVGPARQPAWPAWPPAVWPGPVPASSPPH